MSDLEKPDLKSGVSLASIPDGGKLLGMVDDDEVLLIRRGEQSSQWVRCVRTITDRSQRD